MSLEPKLPLATSPTAAQTLAKFQQALALHQKGQLAQAQAMYEDILTAQPEHFDVLHLLGVIASQTRHYQKAVELIGKAIDLNPNNAAFYSNRGIALQALKQFDAAVASYDKAIALKPDYAVAYSNRGIALQALKQHDAAVASYDKAIEIKPDYAEAHYNRGLVLQDLEKFDAAVMSYDKAIVLKPDYAEAHFNRGSALQLLDQLDAAVVSYDKAIALKPDYADAYYNRGMALKELRRLDAAVASYDKAIALKPDYAEAHYNRGNALHELRRLDAAVASYDKAIVLKPDYAEAHWNKSLALLLGGDFINGLALFEWRWKNEKTDLKKRDFSQPLWLGKESIAGKTVLLHSEQGLGDTIQFCRYAKLVADLGARVILEVPQPLVGLMKSLAGVSEVMVKGGSLPPFDCHCPLLSLPLAFKTDLNSIPSAPHYLRADPDKVSHWASKLGDRTKPRVGLVWSSTSGFTGDGARSVALSDFVKALPESGFEFVCLQKEVKPIDNATLESRPDIKFFGNDLIDFSDTAALIESLDIVVSTCTSVPHLSCALVKPTWILLSYVPDWRWQLDRDDSPWYPSAKLYRQPRVGDWDSVFAKVKADLEQIKS